jgi:phenylacetate-CoA ligase
MSAASPSPGSPGSPGSPASSASPAFYDTLETRDPPARERELLCALPRLLAHARAHAPALGAALADVTPSSVTSRAALATLPVMRKSELADKQRAMRRQGEALGGFSTIGWGARRGARRVFASPGPIYEAEGMASDYWRAARALYAAGFRAGDLVHNSFSYHLTPAGAMMESGAHALGCTVFPGGVGHSELQLQAAEELRADGYVGTPSFLKILLDKAADAGIALPSLRRALLSGEAFPSDLRAWLEARGIQAYQCYATADLGLIAYETTAREGLVLDEHVIVEIVRPGTGEPVPDGEVGEVVVTTLNLDHPLIRFGTGDLSAVLPGCCPTGRTNTRIRGWLGRADQTAKVRGMFVHPAQVADIARRHPEVGRARLVVSGEMASDRMTLEVEVGEQPEGLAARIAESIRDVTKLRGDVVLSAPGSLPNDGKVIDDTRSLD